MRTLRARARFSLALVLILPFLIARELDEERLRAAELPGWLTVVSAEDPEGAELVLESNVNPTGKAYEQARYGQGVPGAQFLVSDVKSEHDRLAARGVKFTMPVTPVTGSIISIFDDTCGNLIQLVQLTWG